jgi:hypothetical protein
MSVLPLFVAECCLKNIQEGTAKRQSQLFLLGNAQKCPHFRF